jgi:hypothetical protein
MVLRKRTPFALWISCVLSSAAIAVAGEGEALAHDPPVIEPKTTTAPASSTNASPANEEKKELDTSVETPKAIYFSGDFAFTRSDLGALHDNTGFGRTAANGLLYGVSSGVRLKDLRLGLRWRVYDTTEFTLWTFALSAGYGLPIRPLSPIFSAHVGYVWDQNIQAGLIKNALPEGTLIAPDVKVKGLLAGIDVNGSYWVTQALRLGVFVGADLMFLSREQAPLPRSLFAIPPEISSQPLYTGSGSAVGLNVNLGIRGAFDIGFQ